MICPQGHPPGTDPTALFCARCGTRLQDDAALPVDGPPPDSMGTVMAQDWATFLRWSGRRWRPVGMVGAAVVAFGLVLGRAPSGSVAPSVRAQTVSTATTYTPGTPPPWHRLGPMAYRIVGAEVVPASSVAGSYQTSGTLLLVDLEARNTGANPHTLDTSMLIVGNAAGHAFKPSGGLTDAINNGLATWNETTINPGVRVTSQIAFDVPPSFSLRGALMAIENSRGTLSPISLRLSGR